MGYYRLLQEILQPLRIYDVESGPSGAELYAQGEALDRVFEELEEAERESVPSSAQDWGLEAYEEIMPFVPEYTDLQRRREAIMALLRIDWCSFTLSALQGTIAGCGVEAELTEAQEPECVCVRLLGVRGIPDNFAGIARRVEQILPCHLGIEYVFTWLIWQELEDSFFNWEELEAPQFSWEELEVYQP